MPKKPRSLPRRSPIPPEPEAKYPRASGRRSEASWAKFIGPNYWRIYQLPCPMEEVQFCHRGWRVDYLWPEQKVALEVEGGVWSRGRHVRGSGWFSDRDKYNELAILGYCLIRCTPDEMVKGTVIPVIQRALERRRS